MPQRTHVATGTTWDVPEEVAAKGGAACCRWIDQQILVQEQKAAEAAQAASAEAMQGAAFQKQVAEMQILLQQQAEQLAALQEENTKLRQASPEAAAGAIALLTASQQAADLRTGLVRDMAMLKEFQSEQLADVSYVAERMKANARADDEARKAKLAASREYMAHLKAGGKQVAEMETEAVTMADLLGEK